MARIRRHGDDTQRLGIGLVLVGCALFAAATFSPVMRWSINAKHDTAGDARIWTGEGWTLADGGFAGAWLLPVASAAIVLLAVTALVARGITAWRAQVVTACVSGYVPAWTAVTFIRKWEDQVAPDVGVFLLTPSVLVIVAGLWFQRPRRDRVEHTAGTVAQPTAADRPT